MNECPHLPSDTALQPFASQLFQCCPFPSAQNVFYLLVLWIYCCGYSLHKCGTAKHLLSVLYQQLIIVLFVVIHVTCS